ncbi:MAG: hypothetical protein V1660_03630 [archaeon]
MGKNWIIFCIILIVANSFVGAEIFIDYDHEAMLMPDSSVNLPVLITNFGGSMMEAEVTCSYPSNITTKCIDSLTLNPYEMKSINLVAKSGGDLGVFPLGFKIGDLLGSINIRVSNAPVSLLNILNDYNYSLSELKKSERTNAEEIENALFSLGNAYSFYSNGNYYKANELAGELGLKLGNLSKKTSEVEISRVRGLVGFSIADTADNIYTSAEPYSYLIIPLILAVFIALAIISHNLPKAIRKEKLSFRQGISGVSKELIPERIEQKTFRNPFRKSKNKKKSNSMLNELFE